MKKKLLIVIFAFACLTGCANSESKKETTVNTEQNSDIISTEIKTTQATTEEIVTTSVSEDSSTIIETETYTEVSTEPEYSDMEYELTDENVKMLGRTYSYNHVLWLSLSASGVEFKVTGKSAEILLYADSTAMGMTRVEGEDNNKNKNRARFAIYIDNVLLTDEIMDEGAKTIKLFEDDQIREAVVKVVKLSESSSSSVGIKSVSVKEGKIEPTENKDLYIEFVGDSITCGYGVDDEDRNHSFSTSTEDATKTYAYKTAEMLNADYSLVSFSGFGIVSGFTSTGEKQANQILPTYYEKVGFSWSKAGGAKIQDWAWDFSKRQPDVVVINLGTNDNSYVGSDETRKTEFMLGYYDFIKQIRKNNPNAHIICSFGIAGDSLFEAIEKSVEYYIDETGDNNVSSFHFNPMKSEEGYAAEWHPTAATHERCAKELSWYINYVTCLDDTEIDQAKPMIALTFDDGPNTTTTNQVLDVLEENGVVASFFLIGKNITKETEAVIKRAHNMGCEINSHSQNHEYMNKITTEEILEQTKPLAEKIYSIIGEYPYFFRPPYYAVNEDMVKNISVPFIFGYGCNDWENTVDVNKRVEGVLDIAHKHDSAIVLLHDAAGNTKTVEALKEIIPKLKAEGYQFVTVSQLFKANNIIPQQGIYYNYAAQKNTWG